MNLADVPIVFVLIGVVLYTVLGGADFGAGAWYLLAGRGPRAARRRELAHDAIAPVWEANHVWLIFVLTVLWTAYPVAFGSIASTLSVALFIAALGVVMRGASYALHSGSPTRRQQLGIDAAFSLSSIITPFAFGAAVGGIASRRVPVGNASGNLVTSWLNPTSILIGVLFVITGAYLAAVYLAADAARLGDQDLEHDFRIRALLCGVVAGAVALGGLAVLHSDAHPLYHGLVDGDGLPALVVSVLAGLATLALVAGRRFEGARYTAALAVAAIVAGWALAQQPLLLPGLTIDQAAAPHDTLVAVIVAVVAGAVIVLPSLGLLFTLTLRGDLRHDPDTGGERPVARELVSASAAGLYVRLAGACLIAGFGFLTVADAAWAHAIGVAALFGFVVLGFLAAAPAQLAAQPPDPD